MCAQLIFAFDSDIHYIACFFFFLFHYDFAWYFCCFVCCVGRLRPYCCGRWSCGSLLSFVSISLYFVYGFFFQFKINFANTDRRTQSFISRVFSICHSFGWLVLSGHKMKRIDCHFLTALMTSRGKLNRLNWEISFEHTWLAICLICTCNHFAQHSYCIPIKFPCCTSLFRIETFIFTFDRIFQ